MDGVGNWPALTDEQYAIIITAEEEAAVNDILDEFRARQRWAETGSKLTPSDLDIDAKRALIPHFSQVLADMVARDWIDLFRGFATIGSVKLTPDEAIAAINDPRSWIGELDDTQLVGLTTGDEWDRVTGRRF
jgi:hypothetical protein